MGQTEYNTAVLADSPKVFYKLDDASGLIQDSSGNALHATATTGTPTYNQTGPFTGSKAIIYSSGTTYHSRNPVTTVTDNLTVEFWAKIDSASANSFIMNGSNGVNGWRITSAVVKAVATNQNHGVNFNLVGWRYFVTVLRAGTWEVYHSGDLFNSNIGTTAPTTPTASTFIGSLDATCSLSNVAIYETALSAARITAHYNAAMDFVRKSISIPSPNVLSPTNKF